jgi:anti-sigma factor RsiW
MTMNAEDRKDISDLLPWYVAGTLDADGTAQIEAALARDPSIAEEIALLREDRDASLDAAFALPLPSAKVQDRLFAAIAQEPQRQPSLLTRIKAFDLAGLLAGALRPRTLAYASMAGALALVLQGGIIAKLVFQDGGARYGTASYTATDSATNATYLLVGFQPGAQAGDIASLLQDSRAVIVDGPKPGGLFQLRIGNKDMDKAEVDKLVTSLRANTNVVRFAAPASR